MKSRHINQAVLLLILDISPTLLSASTEFSASSVYTWIFQNMLFVIAGIVIFGALIALSRLMSAFIFSKRQGFLRE